MKRLNNFIGAVLFSVAMIGIVAFPSFFYYENAKADAPRTAYYLAYANDAHQLELNYSQWNTFAPDSFSALTDGIFRLDATGFPPVYSGSTAGFTAQYVGLVKLNGKCIQPKAQQVDLHIQFKDGRYQDILSTDDRVFDFFVAFAAGDFQLLARSPVYTTLKCVVLFEVVG